MSKLHGNSSRAAGQPTASALSSWSGYPAAIRTCHLGEWAADQQNLGERGKERGGEEKRNKRKEEIRREEQLFSAQFVLHTRNGWAFPIL